MGGAVFVDEGYVEPIAVSVPVACEERYEGDADSSPGAGGVSSLWARTAEMAKFLVGTRKIGATRGVGSARRRWSDEARRANGIVAVAVFVVDDDGWRRIGEVGWEFLFVRFGSCFRFGPRGFAHRVPNLAAE